MASRAFTISAVPEGGVSHGVVGADRFVWTAENGAMPRGDMPLPTLTHRTKRTEYTGNEGKPTEQMLGWQLDDDWTVSGDWDWRRMGIGEPEREKTRMFELIKSGQRVRVQLDNHRYIGVITKLAPVIFAYGIRYTLTISPHSEQSGASPKAGGLRGQAQIRTPDEYYADVFATMQSAIDRQSTAPLWAFSGSYHADMAVVLEDLSGTLTEITGVLDSREDSRTTPLSVIRASVGLFAQAQASAAVVADELAAIDSDVILAWDNPVGVLAFESWSRGIASDMRECQWRAHEATIALGQRIDPTVLALYRPARGESMYSIARRFYGDPLLNRVIQDRNRLGFTNLQGTETLVIPLLGVAT